MKTQRTTLLVAVLVGAVALPALAGEKEKEYGGCKMETQSCLNEMVAKLKGRGWLGIEMEPVGLNGEKIKDDKGTADKAPVLMRVTRVIQGSPAQAAGFKDGDILVSVNGVKFADNTEEKCATCEATKDNWTPGTKATYVVRQGGKDVTLNATLAALPPDVLAQWVGMHMIEHAKVADVAKK